MGVASFSLSFKVTEKTEEAWGKETGRRKTTQNRLLTTYGGGVSQEAGGAQEMVALGKFSEMHQRGTDHSAEYSAKQLTRGHPEMGPNPGLR